MTYQQLLERLQALAPEQLAQDVTVYDMNNEETYSLGDCDVNGEEGPEIDGPGNVLDDGHFYLVRTF